MAVVINTEETFAGSDGGGGLYRLNVFNVLRIGDP
jgi:hypothetical protein